MMPKRLLLFSLVVVTLVSSCSQLGGTQPLLPVQPTISPSQSILDYFPLKKGSYWVYQGMVKWTKINSSEVIEEEIIWKMEVDRVFQRNTVVGYEMIGAPWDLAWYEAGKEPSRYGIIQAGGQFYRVPVETVIRLMNEEDNLFGLVDQNDLLLDAPLTSGKKFCDTISITRPDNMYCWNVGEPVVFDPGNIKGIDVASQLWEYPIVNGTMPDASRMCFVPGIGISCYSYVHHGTVSEVDVHLTEYYPGD